MAKSIACAAEQANCTRKETKAVLKAVKTVLQKHLETQPGQKIRVNGLFSAVALQKPGKDARTKKVFGKTVDLPSAAPYTIVRLTPSKELCVTRAVNN